MESTSGTSGTSGLESTSGTSGTSGLEDTEKYYYIINNRIIEYTYQLDLDLYSYEKLNREQTEFYLQNLNASLQEILAMELNPPYVKTLEDYRKDKQSEIENTFQNILNAGYYDEIANVTIKIQDYDRNQFNQRITLLSITPEEYRPTTTTITDIKGEPKTLSLPEFFRLMMYMGAYYDNIWSIKATKDVVIKNAQTIEEIQNITW